MTARLSDPEIDRLVAVLNEQRGGGAAAAAAGAEESPFEPAAEEEDGAGWEAAATDASIAPPRRPPHRAAIPAATPPPFALAAVDPALGRVPAEGRLGRLLARLAEVGATDLLLVPGQPPVVRRSGRLERTDGEPLADDGVGPLFAPHLGDRARRQLGEHGAADFSLRLAGDAAGRFRVNLHRQGGKLAAAVRALPREVPSLAELHLPASLAELVRPARGLVLLAGPTGAGKSTTIAALVGEIVRTRAVHVITIEEPVEYEHRSRQAVVEQVEVGRDAPSFAAALRAALRQDPDVIVLGEMRDLDTMAIALTAAETGHLVLSSLHANDVVQAVHRVVDVFPPAQQAQVRHQLSLALSAIVAQQLVPVGGGVSRLPAVEVLVATPAVRHLLRGGELAKLYNELTLGKRHGMVSLEESLARLVAEGLLEPEEARLRATRPDELASLLTGSPVGTGR
ncbi:MAG TPA: PilT/PilU family type 4a pilus ATPase [Thermoanaerobaculia bacterium]|nr:PilT/PilU family type 4a pilus ATPase [Thermoanaerobaculia bacterium]